MASIDDLKAAFAGESQANRSYLAFAKQADVDGRPQIAKLFRAAAAAETVHAHAHLAAMGGIGTTAENLATAIAGEAHEFQSMYPEFVARAEAEGNRAALRSFRLAMAVEKTHHDLYQAALAALNAGVDLETAEIWVCPVCGHTEIGPRPGKCQVCGAPGAMFSSIA